MYRFRPVLIIISLVFTALITASAQTKWNQVSSFRFNWDQHTNVQIVLEIPYPWSDPGDFTRIRIRVPGKKDFILTNKNGWVQLKHYYGWAGAQCREDVAVVLHPPKGKKPVIMSTQEAEKLTSEK